MRNMWGQGGLPTPPPPRFRWFWSAVEKSKKCNTFYYYKTVRILLSRCDKHSSLGHFLRALHIEKKFIFKSHFAFLYPSRKNSLFILSECLWNNFCNKGVKNYQRFRYNSVRWVVDCRVSNSGYKIR